MDTSHLPSTLSSSDVYSGDFFAPVSYGALEELLIRREHIKNELECLCATVQRAQAGAMGVLINANLEKDSHIRVDDLFDLERGIKQLDSDMWHRAMRLTDVWEYMPQARRSQWNTQLRAWKDERGYQEGKNPELDLLPFVRDTVVQTIKQLLLMRTQFFSEKVDGIFRGLSGEHVTNSPMGFGKRMIIAYALRDGGYPDHSRAGLIDDLRMVIAKFRGMPEKLGISSYELLQRCYRTQTGEWFDIDGGALRLRVYKVGTAHLEVHEDLAWKLNKVLATLYPAAIPSEFRQPSKKRKVKDFNLFDDLLPSAVRNLIGAMRSRTACGWGFDGTYNVDKAIISEAEAVLRAVGGVEVEKEVPTDRWGGKRKMKLWQFDYDFQLIQLQLAGHGRIPNAKSHQFYPTPEGLARDAVALAEDGAMPGMLWLEPSAGQGGLADLMPKPDTVCIEISRLHCDILRAKGHQVEQADFLQWSPAVKPNRIVMNPPFSEGRWQAHVEHAAGMLADGGKLVAIVPASAKERFDLPGLTITWSSVYVNEFKNASVDVVILTARAPG